MAKKDSAAPAWDTEREKLAARHLRFGWWALLVFLSIGIALEAMHAFKVDAYLNVAHETRRLVLRLGHAHGTLLAVVNIAFAVTVRVTKAPGSFAGASRLLIVASLLLPGGFLLGALAVHGGDPGPGILLVPVGALALLVGVFLVARGAGR